MRLRCSAITTAFLKVNTVLSQVPDSDNHVSHRPSNVISVSEIAWFPFPSQLSTNIDFAVLQGKLSKPDELAPLERCVNFVGVKEKEHFDRLTYHCLNQFHLFLEMNAPSLSITAISLG